MIDGSGRNWTNVVGSGRLMPRPTIMPKLINNTYPSGRGHEGNGYARIMLIN
jgi:hypothetical protein